MICDKYYVIDSHCHVYPEKIASAAVSATDAFYGIVSDFNGTVAQLSAQMNDSGVDHAIIQSVATTPKQVSSINTFIAGVVEQGGGKFTGLGTLHPDSEDLQADINQIISLGLKGVKLHPDIQKFKIDDYRCLKIYELCEREKLPILMHTGDNRYDYSNPNRLLPVLETYTSLTVIGAHLGGFSVWEEASSKLSGLPNFYVDTSSSVRFLSTEQAKNIIKKYGAEHVLYATDYPMYPQTKEIDNLLCMGLSDDEYEKIFSLNAKRVFNIK